jgi:hypothetical protein
MVASSGEPGLAHVPLRHFVFCTVDDYGRRLGPFKVCQGWNGTLALTHGMEDPKAASYAYAR